MRRCALLLSVSFALAACANIWGFDDLSGPGGLGSAGARGFAGGPGFGGTPGTAGAQGVAGAGCTRPTCGYRCGEIEECGVALRCATCKLGETCGGNGTPNVCAPGSCTPSCEGKPCGASNGCDGFCATGPCAKGQHCAIGACVDDATCSIGAPCPAVDCAQCQLYCDATGTCVYDGKYSCTVNAECGAGKVCSYGNCFAPSPGSYCSYDEECSASSVEPLVCQQQQCCTTLGNPCTGKSLCCGGRTCEKRGAAYECCVALRGQCDAATDCCSTDQACEASVCCMASGHGTCKSNADCCASSPGCVAGVCR